MKTMVCGRAALLIRRHIADGDLAYFTTWCPAGTSIETLVSDRGPSLGDRGQFRDRQERVWARSQRDQVLAWLASSRLVCHARLRHDGGHPASGQSACAQKNQLERDAKAFQPHPLVDPGNPSDSAASRAKAHPTRLCHRMVALAPSSSGRRAKSPLQNEITTVMLDCGPLRSYEPTARRGLQRGPRIDLEAASSNVPASAASASKSRAKLNAMTSSSAMQHLIPSVNRFEASLHREGSSRRPRPWPRHLRRTGRTST